MILCAGNFLEGGGDDEVTVVHGYHVRCELGCEVVIRILLLPAGAGPRNYQIRVSQIYI